MEERPFMDASIQPTDLSLQSCLGDAFAYYQVIRDQANQFTQTWNWTKSSGWMLKVFDRKKALFYLVPLQGAFRISLTLRENERAAFLQDGAFSDYSEPLLSAQKFVEGFVVRFTISSREDSHHFQKFIQKLITLRREV